MSDQKGLSIIDFMLAGVLLGGVFFLYHANTTQQMALAENMRFRLEVYNMRQITQSLLSDPNNCTASVQAAYPKPPDLLISTDLPAIKNGNETFYSVGKDYNGVVKLTDMTIRPFDEKLDRSQGHKLEMKFKSNVEKSQRTYTRTFNFTFDQRPLPLFPNYPFRCSLTPSGTHTQDLVDVEKKSLPCNDVVVKPFQVNCPTGKKPLSCGLELSGGDQGKDRVLCHTDQSSNSCLFTHDSVGSCDVVHGHCYCM